MEGRLPEWLTGSLLRTGPARFEFEDQKLNHWYDGMAMLHKFTFRDGKVSYANRFLESEVYQLGLETGRLRVSEYATDPCRPLFKRFMAYFSTPGVTDNGNINIIRYDDVLAATSETPLPVRFDPDTLASGGHVEFEDDLDTQVDIAHPHYDRDGTIYSYAIHYGLHSRYYVYRIRPGTRCREVIAEIPTAAPSYMHSFAMTEHYLVLTAIPKVLYPFDVVLKGQPLIDLYRWDGREDTVYYVIDKKTGEIRERRGRGFFYFHHVNAWEEGDTLKLDIITFPDDGVLRHLYLDDLRSNRPTEATGYLHRATIPLRAEERVEMDRLTDHLIELPRINYEHCNTRPYRYVYGTGNTIPGNFLDNLIKVDVRTGEARIRHIAHHYPSEPVFVPAPGARAEDEGVLLSIVLDSQRQSTYLLVLRAEDLQELARVETPHLIPFTFHGIFSPASRAADGNGLTS